MIFMHYWKKGFPIERKAFTCKICRASMTSKILTHHPIFSAMMPCRISTFEQEGKTYLVTYVWYHYSNHLIIMKSCTMKRIHSLISY
ncbi:MAG: DUF302 domain-containing protein [Ignavibacteria bacterium]|nr:DUF302 domain-containing protein [Ignavibacteria bacterium]